ncbi:MAG: RHS repeat-associated protein [Flavobacteriales bacterium]
MDQNELVSYIHSDHLYTPRYATNSDGDVVWRWISGAFGNELAANDPDLDGVMTEVPFRFPGQYFDGETGLHYNHFRYYDASLGRYLTSDPIGLGGGINTYGYAQQNPVNFIDPTGEAAQTVAIPIGIGLGLYCILFPQSCSDILDACGELIDSYSDTPPPLLSERPPGFWPGDRGASEWDRRNGTGRKGRDKFHDIKQRDRGPASGPRDDTSVNPETGEVLDGNGEHIGDLDE